MTEITDKAGRRITLRKVGVLDMLRLIKAVGGELANNQAYMNVAEVAASAAMINDVPVPFPVNEAGVEALIERLGDDGMQAIFHAGTEEPQISMVTDAGN